MDEGTLWIVIGTQIGAQINTAELSNAPPPLKMTSQAASFIKIGL